MKAELFSTGRTSAGHAQKWLKTQSKVLSAGPGAHISTGQDCQVQKPKRDPYTLCHLPEGEPSAAHLLLILCSHEIKNKNPNLHKQMIQLILFFSSQLYNEPSRVSELWSLFAIYSIFTPTDGFSFPYLSIAFFFFMTGHLKYLIVKPFVLNWQPHALSASVIPLWHLFSHLLSQLRNLNSQKTNLTKKTNGFLLVYFCELKCGGRRRAGGLPTVAGSCWVFRAVMWNNSLRTDQRCVSLVPPKNTVWNKIIPMAYNK